MNSLNCYKGEKKLKTDNCYCQMCYDDIHLCKHIQYPQMNKPIKKLEIPHFSSKTTYRQKFVKHNKRFYLKPQETIVPKTSLEFGYNDNFSTWKGAYINYYTPSAKIFNAQMINMKPDTINAKYDDEEYRPRYQEKKNYTPINKQSVNNSTYGNFEPEIKVHKWDVVEGEEGVESLKRLLSVPRHLPRPYDYEKLKKPMIC